MSGTIPAVLRAAVVARAEGRCEYYLKPQIGFFPHEVEHVIAIKHGGQTATDNLALACFQCNRYKAVISHRYQSGTGGSSQAIL